MITQWHLLVKNFFGSVRILIFQLVIGPKSRYFIQFNCLPETRLDPFRSALIFSCTLQFLPITSTERQLELFEQYTRQHPFVDWRAMFDSFQESRRKALEQSKLPIVLSSVRWEENFVFRSIRTVAMDWSLSSEEFQSISRQSNTADQTSERMVLLLDRDLAERTAKEDFGQETQALFRRWRSLRWQHRRGFK